MRVNKLIPRSVVRRQKPALLVRGLSRVDTFEALFVISTAAAAASLTHHVGQQREVHGGLALDTLAAHPPSLAGRTGGAASDVGPRELNVEEIAQIGHRHVSSVGIVTP
ncbi:hypothetical protein [Streptomyces botrytidirepellens]|uniref:Uncharacterized protein n=1 Tax=Streptomyces botrytidirepellens TaxID=2486417 RepID=A0A3M8WME9_9ACTN|nr:hypothetical protein [Streptomyces botrytidirepellens]RNG30450.1 hypothetical protein EEJ42_10495 [Streptomyces botrytidirepellens]